MFKIISYTLLTYALMLFANECFSGDKKLPRTWWLWSREEAVCLVCADDRHQYVLPALKDKLNEATLDYDSCRSGEGEKGDLEDVTEYIRNLPYTDTVKSMLYDAFYAAEELDASSIMSQLTLPDEWKREFIARRHSALLAATDAKIKRCASRYQETVRKLKAIKYLKEDMVIDRGVERYRLAVKYQNASLLWNQVFSGVLFAISIINILIWIVILGTWMIKNIEGWGAKWRRKVSPQSPPSEL